MSDARQAQCKQCGDFYDATDPGQVVEHENTEHGKLSALLPPEEEPEP